MKVTSYLFALYILGLPLVSYAHEGHEQSGFAGLIHYLSDPMHVFFNGGRHVCFFDGGFFALRAFKALAFFSIGEGEQNAFKVVIKTEKKIYKFFVDPHYQ